MPDEQIPAGFERRGQFSSYRGLGWFVEIDRHIAAEDGRKPEVPRLLRHQVEALEANAFAVFGANPVRTLPPPVPLKKIALQPAGGQPNQPLGFVYRCCRCL